ncbi:MAG: hypothetical protein ACKODX_12275 [Gemmata sp.]
MLPYRSKLFAFVAAAVATITYANNAEAGWVTMRNDTNKPIVVQEVTTQPNGKQVRGKPTKLLAGESFREFQNMPGVKSYEVLDAANTNLSLWTGNLNCKSESQTFSVTNAQGKVGVMQLPEPKKN